MSVPISAKFTTKRHSTRPYLRLLVTDKDGAPFSFFGATRAKFSMATKAGEEKVYSDAVIESPATTGVLRYEWAAEDVDTAGEFTAEFSVEYPDAEMLKVPLQGMLLVRIYEDISHD